MHKVLQGDCLDLLRALDDESVDSVITDPPAGIGFMNKEWDSFGVKDPGRTRSGDPKKNQKGILPGYGRGGTNKDHLRHARSARDAFIPWLEERLAECYRVLKPGGHMLVWAIPRTSHWTATAIEDAGFEIRDVVTHLFGTGFPKNLDVSKSIDKAGGLAPKKQAELLRERREASGMSREEVAEHVGCTPSSVRDWEEGRSRKSGAPLEWITPSLQYREKIADLLGYSSDERLVVGVATDRRGDGTTYTLGHSGNLTEGGNTSAAAYWKGWGTALKPASEHWILARRPLDGTVAQNVLEHGVGGLNIDGCRVPTVDGKPAYSYPKGPGGIYSKDYQQDSDVAKNWNSFSTKENNKDSEGHSAGRWPANVVLDEEAAKTLDDQSGVGNSGGASRFFYCAKASRKEKEAGLDSKNSHPTVKSVALMRWLCRLITPPGGLVLDPFCGSGSTGVACVEEGFRFHGMEAEEEYVKIAKQRITHAKKQPKKLFNEEYQ